MNNYKITKMATGYWCVHDKRTDSFMFEVFETDCNYVVIMRTNNEVLRFDKLVQVANLARALTPTLNDDTATQLDWI